MKAAREDWFASQDALDWDAAHRGAFNPDFPMSGEGRAEAWEQVRGGLAQLRASVLAGKDEIRRERRAAGLENR